MRINVLVDSYSKLLSMAFVTATLPRLGWSPRDSGWGGCPTAVEAYTPKRNFMVRCVMAGKNHEPKWELDTLFFQPGQYYVPIMLMDSMGKNFARDPYSVHIVRCGAKAHQLCAWAKDHLPWFKARLPLQILLVVIGGGNNLTAKELKQNMSPEDLARKVTNEWGSLDQWCKNEGIDVVFAHTLPRPAEQDDHLSLNSPHVRKVLSKSFVAVNTWVEERNRDLCLPSLILSRMVEHDDKRKRVSRRGDEERLVKQRLYPGTEQRRIRLNLFSPKDKTHLSEKGQAAVEGALQKFLEHNISH